MSAARSGLLIWRCGVAEGRPRQPGVCSWCGEAIELADPSDYRRRQRTRHRGDRHEVGGRECQREWLRSRAWNARALIFMRGDPCCVDCGDTTAWWEADHRVPLIDGGPHDVCNIERRCVPCHRAKTAAENRARAEARRRALAASVVEYRLEINDAAVRRALARLQARCP